MDAPRRALSRAIGPALALPAAVFLALFFVWPVASIVELGLRPGGRWDLAVVGDVLGDASLRRVIGFTIAQAAISTAVTVALALPAAHVLACYEFPGRRAVRALVAVPFVLPTVVVGAAFVALIGPRSPIGIDLDGTVWAIVAAHVFFNHSVVVRLVGGLWETLDPTGNDVARTLGAGPWRAFRTVTWPALRPAIVAASSIVFLFTFTSFGVVRLLGGPRETTLEVEIYRQTADLLDLPTAAVLSLIQMGTVACLLVVAGRLYGRRHAVVAAPGTPRPVKGPAARAWVAVNLLVVGVVVATPLAVLVDRSLQSGDGRSLEAWRALGRREPRSALSVPGIDTLTTSLRFAALATVIAVLLGSGAAVALTLSGRRGRAVRSFDAALAVPLGTSAVTVGFGLLVTLDTPALDLRDHWVLVPVAQAVVALPFVVRTLEPVLAGVDRTQLEAAAVLGASPGRAWRSVVAPLAWRALLVAAGFAFVISLGEFGATTVIARADTPTVPVAIDRLLARPGTRNVSEAFALASTLAIITIAMALLIDVAGARGRTWQEGRRSR